ncbi:Transcriptional regulator, TetR family [Fulvivirga imtechensis AK7]|uniref:Transcriptional regulator, TetR family n=1 Tax=Fulvivirga imtechensis AK7 TaxID=1237149 RepID=L8JUQ6_9BACT|nr:TetR/AcrR family transcriptional regulator [Fulvivirga imtechensis]ELR72731.1 Transcriptional regulator, TetR family [Fulvivirga imtechensis AK7]
MKHTNRYVRMNHLMSTRDQILSKNYEAMCLHGFQGLRTDKVINDLGITKGAFYHYFSGKKELGYAIVDEIIAPHYISNFKRLEGAERVIDAIIEALESIRACSTEDNVHIGCPLNNLIQEMSPLDSTFRNKLNHILKTQKELLADALKRGMGSGEIKKDIEPEEVALYILASIEGTYTLAKSFQSKKVFDQSMDQLTGYIKMLKG